MVEPLPTKGAEGAGSPYLAKLRQDAALQQLDRAVVGTPGPNRHISHLPADKRLDVLLGRTGEPAEAGAGVGAIDAPVPAATLLALEKPRKIAHYLSSKDESTPLSEVAVIIAHGKAESHDRRVWAAVGSANQTLAARARHDELRHKLAQPWNAESPRPSIATALASTTALSGQPYVSPLRALRAAGSASPRGKGDYVSPLRSQTGSGRTVSQQRWAKAKREQQPITPPRKLTPFQPVGTNSSDARLAGGPSNGMLPERVADDLVEGALEGTLGTTATISAPIDALRVPPDKWNSTASSPSTWSEWR
eukprot:COSAG02_NODE_10867_length_1842_cov_2.116466_1_plen_307_part_00